MILAPSEFDGPIMDLATSRRAMVGNMNYLGPERVEMDFEIPLAEIVFDFFDLLKSKTKGYASLDYEPIGYRASDLVKVDILLNGIPVDAFSAIVHRDKAYDYGTKMTGRLRNLIRASSSTCPSRPPSAVGSSAGRPSRPAGRT